MSAAARFAVGALAAVLLVLVATLGKPGLPPNLKADEAAYHMMAQSLAFDRDLVVEVADIDRSFDDFHYLPTRNVVLATTDGWQSVTYGKPWVYSAFGAPLVRLFRGNGLLVLNMLLFVAMIASAASRLARRDHDGPTTLFVVLFFLLSNAFAYVFWLQPEVFLMASAFFAVRCAEVAAASLGRRRFLLAALSGLILALGTYHKPMLAAFALAAVVVLRRERPIASVASWLLGFLGALGLVAAISIELTATPSAYLGVTRQGVTICEPGRLPLDDVAAILAPAPPPPQAAGAEVDDTATADTSPPVATTASPTGGSWSWIFRVPPLEPRAFAQSLGSFLWGRHTGMLAYMPFALVAVGLFLRHARRDRDGWALLVSIAAVGLFTLLFIPFNWHGGGGFVGNRYFVIAYPAFVLLVPRVSRLALGMGTLLGALFTSVLLFAPFGLPVPEPTLQAHVRNPPFRLLPLEIQLRNLPGYISQRSAGTFLLGRREQILPRDEVLWLEGNSRVEVHLASDAPTEPLALLVRSAAPNNHISLSLDGEHQELTLERDEGHRVDFVGENARRVDRIGEGVQWVQRLVVETSAGRNRLWVREAPPRRCEAYAWNRESEENFWTGAELIVLGRPRDVDANVFAANWLRLLVPPQLSPGEKAIARVRVRNTSTATWPAPDTALGAVRVKLVPRWIAADGTSPRWDAPRVELPATVEPGADVLVELAIEAPPTPGNWELEVDLVAEFVGWFSQRGVAPVRRPVTVAAPPDATESDPTPPDPAQI